MLKLPFIAPSIITGLDIGLYSVKMLQVKKSADQYQMLQYAYEEIPAAFDSAKQEENIIETLKKVVNTGYLKKGKLVTAVPRYLCILKYVDLPSEDDAEIRNMIAFEADRHIPFPLEEVFINFQILYKRAGVSKVLLVVIRKEVIQKHLQVLEKAGLSVDIINIAPFALANSYLYNTQDRAGVSALIDIGAHSTEINVLDKGILCFTRSAIIGGNKLTGLIQDETSKGFMDAEKIKCGDKNELEQALPAKKAIYRWQDELLLEIRHSIDTFRSETNGVNIERVILTGGSSILEGLDVFLKEKLGVDVASFDCFNRFDIPHECAFIRKKTHLFAVATGLTLQSYADNVLCVNMLPEELQIKKKKIKRRKLLAMSIAGASLLGLLSISFLVKEIHFRQKEIDTVTGELRRLSPEVRKLRDIKSYVNVIMDYTDNKAAGIEIMRELSALLPLDIYINHFIYDRGMSLKIKGRARSHSSVSRLVIELGKSGYFSKVINMGSMEVTEEDYDVVEFEIECMLS